MPGQLIELFESRAEQWGNSQSAEMLYIAKGCADEAEVKALAESNVPGTYNGLRCLSIEIRDRVNNDSWRVSARFGVPQPHEEETPQPTISFDTSGGTRHITQSLATVASMLPNGDAAPSCNGAIGYDGENINGVEITIPAFSWQETHYLSSVNQYSLYSLTGCVNSDAFHGYQAGEVLFLGTSGQKRIGPNGLWELTYKFAFSPNVQNLQIPGFAQAISKKGWEYLWLRYGDKIIGNTKVKQPIAAYVEKVYDEGPFSILGI